MSDEPEIVGSLIVKLPIFVFGVALGMAVVWVAFQWVPGAMRDALATVAG
jgi:hypothetical protein